MNQIQEYRKRAIALLAKNLEGEDAFFIDYQIDDYLRDVFKLPDRPFEALPYVGWMTPSGVLDSDSMTISQVGIELIKSHEGLRTKAYMCPANVLTIGYGHTRNVFPNQVITLKEAERLLKEDLRRFENAINKHVTVSLNQNQFDALVSFTFNVGANAFRNSTLLRLLNNQDYYGAAFQFDRWVNGGGGRLPGLVRRREEERKLFMT